MRLRSVALLLLTAGAVSLIAWVTPGWSQGTGNPLFDLLGVIGRGFSETADEIDKAQGKRDQLDIRPAQRPEDNRALTHAITLLGEKRWNEGLESLQYLLDQPADAFSFRPDLSFVSLQADVDRMLEQLPAEARRIYETRYSSVADKLFEEAQASQNEPQLVDVSKRFLQTSAGQKALALLVRQWADRGDYGAAARGFGRLLPKLNAADKDANLRQLATYQALSGNAAAAKETVKELDEATKQQIALIVPPLAAAPDATLSPVLPSSPALRLEKAPVLQPGARWSADLIERFAVSSRLEDLREQLRFEKRALVPLNPPLAVGDRIAFRTLRGLQVRSLRDGQLQWERRASGSPEERALSETDLPWKSLGAQFNLRGIMLDRDDLAEQDQLTSLLYRDGVFASLSSDGVRLFGVEDHGSASFDAPLSMWRESRESNTNADWSTNILAAYDVESGRVLWRLGGPAVEAEFSARLAGTFFFGAPLPDNHELLAIGEREGEVRLMGLSPQTGDELWSVALAAPGSPISQDVIRRHWACQPVVTHGLVLCPTTTGWLAAVDRHTHRLVWVNRYSPRTDIGRNRGGGNSSHLLLSLNERWLSTRPIVHGNSVLIAPPELPDERSALQPMLFCIDVETGKSRWEQPRGEGLCLVGIHNDDLLVVGANTAEAVTIGARASLRWKTSLKDRRPCGQPMLLGHELWIPAEGNRVLKLDAATGRELEVVQLEGKPGDLGNLTLAQGEIISLSYQKLTVFPTNLANVSLADFPDQLVRSELGTVRQLLLTAKYAEALEAIDRLKVPATLSAEVAGEVRDARWRALAGLSLTAADVTGPLQQLKELAQSPPEHRTVQRLSAEAFRKSGDWRNAVPAYLNLLTDWPSGELIVDSPREIRIDGWIHSRLLQLRDKVPEADRAALEDLITSYVSQSSARETQRPLLSRAIAAFAAGADLEYQLAEAAWERGQRGIALVHLERCIAGSSKLHRARGLARLAERFEALEWRADALATWQKLQSEPAVPLPGGEDSQRLAGRRLFRMQATPADAPVAEPKPVAKWNVEQSGVAVGPSPMRPVNWKQRGFAALDNLRMQTVERDENLGERVIVEDRLTGRQLASIPLRGQSALAYAEVTNAWRLGSLALVLHQGVINAISWPDGQLLWTNAPSLKGWEMAAERNMLSSSRGMVNASVFLTQVAQASPASASTLLHASSPWALLIGTRHWSAIDPLTGDLLWRDNLAPVKNSAIAMGNTGFLLSGRDGREIRSVHNGEVVRPELPPAALSGVVASMQGDLITFSRSYPAGKGPHATLARRSIRDEVRWSVEFPVTAPMEMIDDQAIGWVTSDNHLHLIQLDTGKQADLGELPIKLIGGDSSATRRVSLLTDHERWYTLINEEDQGYSHFNIEVRPFRGSVHAHDRDGKLLWKKEFSAGGRGVRGVFGRMTRSEVPLSLVTEDFDINPIILLVGENGIQQDELYHSQMRLVAWDKATGETVLDWKRPTESGGFMDLQVNIGDGSVELRTLESRLKLFPAQGAPAEPQQEPSAP